MSERRITITKKSRSLCFGWEADGQWHVVAPSNLKHLLDELQGFILLNGKDAAVRPFVVAKGEAYSVRGWSGVAWIPEEGPLGMEDRDEYLPLDLFSAGKLRDALAFVLQRSARFEVLISPAS